MPKTKLVSGIRLIVPDKFMTTEPYLYTPDMQFRFGCPGRKYLVWEKQGTQWDRRELLDSEHLADAVLKVLEKHPGRFETEGDQRRKKEKQAKDALLRGEHCYRQMKSRQVQRNRSRQKERLTGV